MMQSRFFHALTIAAAVVLLLFGIGHGLLRHMIDLPGNRVTPTYLYVEPGAGVGKVGRELARLGLVREPWHFKLVTRWKGLDRALYAGEYEIKPNATLREILQKIYDQETYKRRLVVPEGATVADVETILKASFGLDMTGYQIPAEGSLLPETYFYERGDTAKSVIDRMQSAMGEALDDLWMSRAVNLPVSDHHEALVLASIVEKETGVASERPVVAAVFTNRLRKGMRLQSDPTVIYGISQGRPLGRLLTRADLRADTPYNSYRHGGLPPTPIANPGRASLAAVLNPASVSYLYFVADGTGGHAFATTLADHNKNVARWRQIQNSTP